MIQVSGKQLYYRPRQEHLITGVAFLLTNKYGNE
jgi:hypothetical protein